MSPHTHPHWQEMSLTLHLVVWKESDRVNVVHDILWGTGHHINNVYNGVSLISSDLVYAAAREAVTISPFTESPGKGLSRVAHWWDSTRHGHVSGITAPCPENGHRAAESWGQIKMPPHQFSSALRWGRAMQLNPLCVSLPNALPYMTPYWQNAHPLEPPWVPESWGHRLPVGRLLMSALPGSHLKRSHNKGYRSLRLM